MKIQERMRIYLFKFAKNTNWSTLRRVLLKTTSASDLGRLMRVAWVRREWCVEPESWIYMLKEEKENLGDILQEISHEAKEAKRTMFDHRI